MSFPTPIGKYGTVFDKQIHQTIFGTYVKI